MNDRLATHGLLVAMVAVAAVAWWFQLRPALEFDGSRLEQLPLEIGEWQGEPVPLESAVERMLDADLNVQRAYARFGANDGLELVWLYVGYYSTARGGRPEHTPGVCYPSAGWRVVEEREWSGGTDGTLRAVEYVVERDDERRLVHFWYQSSRQDGLLGVWDVSLDQLRTRLANGRADGALVRLSTPIDSDDLAAARERLAAFQARLAPELAARWPVETEES